MKIRKIAAVVTTLIMVCSAVCFATGCGSGSVSKVIRVAVLNGSEGMGMVELMEQEDKYEVTVYESSDEITEKLVNGDVDIAAVPSNLASVLYNKTNGQIKSVSPITLGALYVVENGTSKVKDIGDLKGKTVYASGKGGTSEYVLEELLNASGFEPSDVNVKWLSNHSDAVSYMIKETGGIAMIPEPFVTIAESKSDKVSVALDLNDLWKDVTSQELPMGVVVCQKAFAKDRSDDLEVFMKDCEASVSFVNDEPAEAAKLISRWGFISDADVAEKAIPKCNIVFYSDARESNDILSAFYETLYKLNPKSIGGDYPDSGFFR